MAAPLHVVAPTAGDPPVAEDGNRPAAAPGPSTASAAARRTEGALRRRELAGFLRSRRERIAPEQVGLPPAIRRRTPGLRREEVASLAGVGVTWYTWLEQGREINASAQVLYAVARTLLLDRHERRHLFTLAGVPDGTVPAECEAVPAAVQQMLEKLDPYPACVRNARYDLLGYNHAYRHLIEDLDAKPFEDRNSLWLMFTNPAWRVSVVDWQDATRRMVAEYRSAMAEHVAEPAWKCLVNRLSAASPEFVELWRRHDVGVPENRTKRFLHPRLGLLRLDFTTLWLGVRLGTRVVAYTPADDETAIKLRQLRTLQSVG